MSTVDKLKITILTVLIVQIIVLFMRVLVDSGESVLAIGGFLTQSLIIFFRIKASIIDKIVYIFFGIILAFLVVTIFLFFPKF